MSTSHPGSSAEKRSLDPLIGSLLADKFRVERVIGRGGMGLVYLAQQLEPARPVVIKLLAPQWLDDRTAVARFEREGRRLQQLAHPNVVQMYECGRVSSGGDTAYIAMEYLDGEPLRRFMRRRGRLSLAEFVPIAAQVLAAVGYAHTFNIMLRDIKPPNIMLCERDGKANFVKLLDFGLAKLVDGDHEEVTKSHVIGTAGYLAPEQIKGDPCDVRVDVYAIGVLFYMLLAGESPIAGDNDGALLYNHVHGTPKPLGTVLDPGHNVPEALIALVHQCLEKDPARRLRDANEVAEALFECVPPKLLALPDADDESRRALREYRDARDRGEDDEGAVQESSSEWTKPVVKPADAATPAEASTAALAKPKLGPPKPPSKPNPAAPLRRPTPPLPAADAAKPAELRKPPVRRPTPTIASVRTQGIPERVSDREGSRASAPLPPPRRMPRPKPVSAGSSDAVPAVPRLLAEPKPAASQSRAPEEGMETAVASIHDTGPISAEGGLFDREPKRWSLPVPRRFLVVFGVGLVTLGALLAWVLFVPPEGTPPSTAAATPPSSTSAASSAASPTPASGEPSRAPEVVTPPADVPAPANAVEGAVEFKAIAGARVEIDGVDVGPVPLTKPLPVGTHHVRITAPGYVPWEETIDIVEGDNPALAPRLKRKRGGSKAGLPSVQELGDASGEVSPAPSEPAPADDGWMDSPPPKPVETKPPEPFKPPPAPDPPKRDANPFLPSKPSEPADPGLLPTN